MRDQVKRPFPPMLGLALGIVVASTAAIAIRYAQAYASPLVIAAWRLVLASLVLAPIVLKRESRTLANLSRTQLGLGIASGCFLALHFAAWIASLQYTSVATSVVLVATVPLFVALLAPLALHEPLTRPVLAGLCLALIGVVGIGLLDSCTWENGLRCQALLGGSREAAYGDLLALVGAAAAAAYLTIGRRLRRNLSLLAYIALSYTTAGVVLVVVAVLAGQSLFGYPWIAFLLFAYLALGPQLVGHTSLNWALRYLPAALVATALLGEPIGATALAWLLLNERPASLKLAAMALILGGIWIAARGQQEAAPT
jgi:drug/metabolite transporter (DMT)-like permease